MPESVFPKPATMTSGEGALKFTYVEKPFSFAVKRTGNSDDTIFDTSANALIYQSQYIRLRTSLPVEPNIYGLGEHSDTFKLPTNDYTRTLWSRDAYEIPEATNLYGNHPVYYELRSGKTHAVFLLNSNGMDIKIGDDGGQYLEYNLLGGVIDLYFLAGPDPVDVAQQYAVLAGLPALVPFWGLGFHQCRYGYQDVFEVAGVVANYSAAKIPLETMWTDIDYMDKRQVFTLDGERFTLSKLRELVGYLHDHDQHYIVMVDPAVAASDNEAFNTGKDQNVFLKKADGSIYNGVVWPGVTAYPDWFAPNTGSYWTNQIGTFFNKDSGVDIDGLWIDMNEASNFCADPCNDPVGYATQNGFPPQAPPVRDGSPIPLPGFPSDLQPSAKFKRQAQQPIGLPNRDFLTPPYSIKNKAGSLSSNTIATNLIHAEDYPYAEYDTHNLYGTMMSSASRTAMLVRRPAVRPLIITRSTFAGAGTHVGHWLGDNAATWWHYKISIAQQLQFASLYQVPMVGADVCGFARNTTENLCARWATLGAFSTFYRNHAESNTISQEFYRWESVAVAARKAIEVRYRLLDYIYTALAQQSVDGTPVLSPLWFLYPDDSHTYPIDTQYMYGPSLLVSPVIDEDSTSVSVYFPVGLWYDWWTLKSVTGTGNSVTLDNIGFDTIPLHIRGGSILPVRNTSAMTTTELRTKDFALLIAPDEDGNASGCLYLDDGASLDQAATSNIDFTFGGGKLTATGDFGYDTGVKIQGIVVLGQKAKPGSLDVGGKTFDGSELEFDQETGAVGIATDFDLKGGWEITGF